MPIPLHISPFLAPPGGTDWVGAIDAGLNQAERRKQGAASREMADKTFGRQTQQDAEQRREFDLQHGVSKGYLDLQTGQTEEARMRRERDEQAKLFQQFQLASATGNWTEAQRLQQEIQRRGLQFRAKAPSQAQSPQAAPSNPFDLGAPTLNKPMY